MGGGGGGGGGGGWVLVLMTSAKIPEFYDSNQFD